MEIGKRRLVLMVKGEVKRQFVTTTCFTVLNDNIEIRTNLDMLGTQIL